MALILEGLRAARAIQEVYFAKGDATDAMFALKLQELTSGSLERCYLDGELLCDRNSLNFARCGPISKAATERLARMIPEHCGDFVGFCTERMNQWNLLYLWSALRQIAALSALVRAFCVAMPSGPDGADSGRIWCSACDKRGELRKGRRDGCNVRIKIA